MKATNMSKPIGVGIDPLAPGREPLILGAALSRLSGAAPAWERGERRAKRPRRTTLPRITSHESPDFGPM